MDDATLQLLQQWNALKKQLNDIDAIRNPLAEQELALRRSIVAVLYPKGNEGTNYTELANNWRLRVVIQYDRKVDEAALPAVKQQLIEMGVSADKLIRNVPELNMKPFRELTEEQRKVLEQALTTKPKAPTLELVPPKV